MNSKAFTNGQKVFASYHNTVIFKPPMYGKVLFRWPIRKKHHFSRNIDGKCYWYFVRMENRLIVLMPEVCLKDAKQHIKENEAFLKYNYSRIGQKGFSLEAYNILSSGVAKGKTYTD